MFTAVFLSASALLSGFGDPTVDLSKSDGGTVIASYEVTYTREDPSDVANQEFAEFGVLLADFPEEPEVPVFDSEEDAAEFFASMTEEESEAFQAYEEEVEAIVSEGVSEVAAALNAAGVVFQAFVEVEDGPMEIQETDTLTAPYFRVAYEDKAFVLSNIPGVAAYEPPANPQTDTPVCGLAIDEFALLVPEFDISRDEVVFNDFEEGVCSLTITITGDPERLSALEDDIETLTGAQVAVEALETGAITATLSQAAASEIVFSFVTDSGTRQKMIVGETITVIDPAEEVIETAEEEVVEEAIETAEEAESNDTVIDSGNPSGAPATLIFFALLALAGAGVGFFVYRKRNLDISFTDDSVEEDSEETA
jgi:hypothetical protein